jgi:TfoX/Sxy family transcriptional regulator of competence genes
MPYSEELAERIRQVLAGREGIREQKMFGGIAFLAPQGMFAGVVGDELMARPGPDKHDEAVGRPGARMMDFTGRPMRGMVFVSPEGCAGDRLRAWVEEGYAFVQTLPDKPAPASRRRAGPNRAR